MKYALGLASVLGLIAGAATAQSFSVDRIVFDDSAYLEPEVLDGIASEYVSRPITLDSLNELVDRVQTLYGEAGIVTAQALVPPQTITDGTLRISLVEATIGAVEVDGFPDTDPTFLTGNLTLPVGARPDYEALERDLRIFDIAHDIAPQLEFAPGDMPETTRVVITGEPPPRLSFTLSADNYGREETGIARLSAFARYRSVTGVRDTLSAQVTASEGSTAVSLGYSRPVGPAGGRLIASAGYTESQIISGPFAPVDIRSDSTTAQISYRRPFRVEPFSHWFWEAGVAYDRSVSEILGTEFSDISLWEVFAEVSREWRTERAAWAISAGVQIGEAEAQGTTETEGRYTIIYGDVGYGRPLGQDFVFEGNLRFQYAQDENLPVARLITGGGVGNVRGYPNDARSGDSGFVANLQVTRTTPWLLWEDRVEVNPFGFVDVAAIVPFRVDGSFDPDQDWLVSAGLGATARFNDRAAAVLTVGVPLRETLGFEDTGEAQVYLGVDYRF
ncbi:ShlB/FhaC/HecB family hemolysin secretion/activation protein [Histidinibacterium lentulum]|uniref:ShlB/FhaC/HecB family hemolysin secretion/activation protein n=1 Tax=Histidinibacterium lentulum TaxID=2480588 RepID=A0A3N2QUT5_9RHOB|nr:ShlB/FhaC/HecB family hemolysin secretion/activation protein [Histidinibacterium lentulum]ROT98942.1 ShlB/FhaC/HecB family hemolysin secretion/activation protein [Histidinibacterium lentulum]